MNLKIKKTGTKKGFTLIEMLISIVIFVIFLGIVSSSYVNIVRAQREANDVRRMYSEVRDFVDFFGQEARLSTINYNCYSVSGLASAFCTSGGTSSQTETGTSNTGILTGVCSEYFTLSSGRTTDLDLVRKDGLLRTIFHYDADNKKIQVKQYQKDAGGNWTLLPEYSDGNYKDLVGNSVIVDKLSFAITPDVNPYSGDYYCRNQKQFQPKVTLFATFKNNTTSVAQFSLDYQTTISSRVYSKL